MIPLAFDTETALIRPAQQAPALACLTWQRHQTGVNEARIESEPDKIHAYFKAFLENPNLLLVGHFVSYDLAVLGNAFPDLLPLIFSALEANRVTCTKIRQQLLDIAGGVYRGRITEKFYWIKHEYKLEALASRLAGIKLEKDAWRLSYGDFVGVPLERWPDLAREVQAKASARLLTLPDPTTLGKKEKHLKKEIEGLQALVDGDPMRCATYPLDDARATLAVYLAQEKHAEYLKDQYRQTYAQFALYLSSAWGLRTDALGVEKLAELTQVAYEFVKANLVAAGLVREDGSRDTKAAKARMIRICAEEGLPLRRTPGHKECELGDECTDHVCLDDEACRATEDGLLEDYAEFSTLSKVESNDLKMLRAGTVYPVHPRYDMAETGRTTCSKPNIQNLRRLPGIRECFVPRPGKVFFQVDYPQLELYTLAQCCIKWVGFSKLADALIAGVDPHLAMGARILGITYEEALARKKEKDVKDARQMAKPFNFGKPGGMGDAKFQLFAKKSYGLDIPIDKIAKYTAVWKETWSEMPHYFARIGSLMNEETRKGNVETLFTERFRGGASYCAACNNGFQALGVDIAKRALCSIAKAQYVDTKSPLFGARSVAFVHDEVIGETDDGPRAHDVAFECARLMREAANYYLPDVPMTEDKFEPTLMRVWSKDAVQVWDNNKRLVPWELKAA